jgi:O-antigen ligase
MAASPNYAQNAWSGGNLAVQGTNALATEPEVSAVLKLGFGLLLLDTFLTTSRSLEIIGLDFGMSIPYVATLIRILVFGLAILTGGARRMATSRTGICLILFTGWMMVCTPFSTWRTGSAQTILSFWTPTLFAFMAYGLLSSMRQCRKLGSVMAISGLTIAIASLLVGTYKQQRFSFNSGTLGNANDLSMLLLLAAPFFLVPLLDPASRKLNKVLALIGGLLVLAMNFRTGSRAGLLALLGVLFVLFLTRSMLGKLKLIAVTAALAAVLVAFIPSYSLYRYATVFNEPETVADIRSETFGSEQLRKELLYESIRVTLDHPLVGVGPGVYAPAMAKEAERQGKFAHWAVSHNTYTQVSSEMGIPGLIFYLAAIVCAYLDIFRVRKLSRNDPSSNALAVGLLLSLVGLTINFFFGSNAYVAWLPIVIGLCAALRMNLRQGLNLRASIATANAATPVPTVAFPRTPTPTMAPSPDTSATPGRLGGTTRAPGPPSAPTQSPAYRFLGRPQRIRH